MSNTIIPSIIGATGITYAAQTAAKKPITIKPLIGGFVAGTLLLGVAMWSENVASSFAVIILVTSLLLNGQELFTSVGRLT